MDLLTQTFERVNNAYYINENGEKVFAFKTIRVYINEGGKSIVYSIRRNSTPGIYHMIERKEESVYLHDTNSRYKMYSDEKSFENGIKRIERMAKNQTL
jgi:hypothetical protein